MQTESIFGSVEPFCRFDLMPRTEFFDFLVSMNFSLNALMAVLQNSFSFMPKLSVVYFNKDLQSSTSGISNCFDKAHAIVSPFSSLHGVFVDVVDVFCPIIVK